MLETSRWRRLLLVALAPSLVPAAARAACTLTTGDLDGNASPDLRIVGTPATQRVRLVNNAGALSVFLDCNGDGDFADASLGDLNGLALPGVEAVELQLKGRDTVEYEIQGAVSGALQQLAVTFGVGPNRLTVKGASGASLIDRSSLVVDVAGGPGVDTVELFLQELQPIRYSGVVLRGDLGAGNDVVSFVGTPWTGLQQSFAFDVDVDLALGAGHNLVTLDGKAMDVDSSGTDLCFVRLDIGGGDVASGSDTVLMSGPHSITGRLFVNARLRAGNDSFVGSLDSGAGNSVFFGHLRYRVNGGPGADLLTLPDAGQTSDGSLNGVLEGLYDVALEGGPGNDTLTFDSTFTGLGGGLFRLWADGGDNADTLIAETIHVPDTSTGDSLSLGLQGGRGNDTLFLSGFDPAGKFSQFISMGARFSNGGPNANDLCLGTDFLGNLLLVPLNCEQGFGF
jgi:hypothetical protein